MPLIFAFQAAGREARATVKERAVSRNPLLDRTIRERLSRGVAGARSALRLVRRTRFPDLRYATLLRAEVAQALFADGDDTLALLTARRALAQSRSGAARSESAIGLAGTIGGLAAWREGDIRLAEGLFEQAANACGTDVDICAGAAMWAARTHGRLGDMSGARSWLGRATAFPDTFYGMLAARAEGLPPSQDDNAPPLPRLRPEGGFIVNPALVYALVQVESNFDRHAVSSAGAHGLMQIMPVTARFVVGGSQARKARTIVRALENAGSNLAIGQRYLDYLARQQGIDGDLIRLLASYNAGPNALGRWSRDEGTETAHDPLLFIEALPAPETRDFVRRVLCALWSYDARLHLPSSSLDTLARGGWPGFATERKLAAGLSVAQGSVGNEVDGAAVVALASGLLGVRNQQRGGAAL